MLTVRTCEVWIEIIEGDQCGHFHEAGDNGTEGE